MSPAAAAARLGWSVLLGAAGGLVYDALHPPQLRRKTGADLVFMLVFAWLWLVISFRICRGDIRMGCWLGQLAGLGFWEWILGTRIRRLFGRIWKQLAALLGFFLIPGKNILKFVKKLFASGGKWVYNKVYVSVKIKERRCIPWNKRRIRPSKEKSSSGPRRQS